MVVLESQAGWIVYLLDRMDAVFRVPIGQRYDKLKEFPEYLFSAPVLDPG